MLAEVSGLGTFESVKAALREVEAFGRMVLTLDLEGLIAAKRAAARPKDLYALGILEGLQEVLKKRGED